MGKITFKLCPCCKNWAVRVICPQCRERIMCGALLDAFTEEYTLKGDFEDSMYGEVIECENCDYSAIVGEWVKTEKPKPDEIGVFELKVVFDIENPDDAY